MQNTNIATKVATAERTKLTPFYVNIPRTDIIAESEKSILINASGNSFWLAKQYAKNSDLYKFCDVVQITLFQEWVYEMTEDLSLNDHPIINKHDGQSLSAFLLDEFENYNYSNLNKK